MNFLLLGLLMFSVIPSVLAETPDTAHATKVLTELAKVNQASCVTTTAPAPAPAPAAAAKEASGDTYACTGEAGPSGTPFDTPNDPNKSLTVSISNGNQNVFDDKIKTNLRDGHWVEGDDKRGVTYQTDISIVKNLDAGKKLFFNYEGQLYAMAPVTTLDNWKAAQAMKAAGKVKDVQVADPHYNKIQFDSLNAFDIGYQFGDPHKIYFITSLGLQSNKTEVGADGSLPLNAAIRKGFHASTIGGAAGVTTYASARGSAGSIVVKDGIAYVDPGSKPDEELAALRAMQIRATIMLGTEQHVYKGACVRIQGGINYVAQNSTLQGGVDLTSVVARRANGSPILTFIVGGHIYQYVDDREPASQTGYTKTGADAKATIISSISLGKKFTISPFLQESDPFGHQPYNFTLTHGAVMNQPDTWTTAGFLLGFP